MKTTTKSLGIAGIIAAIVGHFTSTGTHSTQLAAFIGGLVLYIIDHLGTVLSRAKGSVPAPLGPAERAAMAALDSMLTKHVTVPATQATVSHTAMRPPATP